MRIEFEIRGLTATIYERRPPWPVGEQEWTTLTVARIRYDTSAASWTLYWSDSDQRWHQYDIRPSSELAALLVEVERDPTGIFWG